MHFVQFDCAQPACAHRVPFRWCLRDEVWCQIQDVAIREHRTTRTHGAEFGSGAFEIEQVRNAGPIERTVAG